MDKVIYTSPIRHTDADCDEVLLRIRQVSHDDCIVEFSLDGEGWDTSGDDAICSSVYMEAFLAERAKTDPEEQAFLRMKTSIEDQVSQTGDRVTKKMIREVVRFFTVDSQARKGRKAIEERLFGAFGLA